MLTEEQIKKRISNLETCIRTDLQEVQYYISSGSINSTLKILELQNRILKFTSRIEAYKSVLSEDVCFEDLFPEDTKYKGENNDNGSSEE